MLHIHTWRDIASHALRTICYFSTLLLQYRQYSLYCSLSV